MRKSTKPSNWFFEKISVYLAELIGTKQKKDKILTPVILKNGITTELVIIKICFQFY